MKDKLARALAIVALVFMGIFLAAFTATLIDRTLLGGAIGYITIGALAVVLVILLALKLDGRGVSITRMNNEAEMNRILEDIEKNKAEAAAEGQPDAPTESDIQSDTDEKE